MLACIQYLWSLKAHFSSELTEIPHISILFRKTRLLWIHELFANTDKWVVPEPTCSSWIIRELPVNRQLVEFMKRQWNVQFLNCAWTAFMNALKKHFWLPRVYGQKNHANLQHSEGSSFSLQSCFLKETISFWISFLPTLLLPFL